MRSVESKLLNLGNCAATLSTLTGRVGICTGCFDILQSGHAVFFEQCKQHCDHLIVIVGKSCNISRLKPGRPINPDSNRMFLVAALETVDFAILGDDAYSYGKIDCVSFCDAYQPDVYVVNDDDSALLEKQAFAQRRGIDLVTVSRTVPNFLVPTSTTEIVEAARKSGSHESVAP